MALFTVAEATDPDVQSDVLGRWLESRGVSRAGLSQWPPQPGDPHAALANALVTRIGTVQTKLAQHWGTRAGPEIASGQATPEDIRKAIERFLTIHAGVVETHIVELWDRTDSEIATELLAWYDRAVPAGKRRQIMDLVKAPSSMEFLPAKEKKIRLKYLASVPRSPWTEHQIEKPATHHVFLRPDDPRFWRWLRDSKRLANKHAAREAARAAEAAADLRRRRQPVEVYRPSKSGTVSAGPRQWHKRKPKKKR